MTIEVVYADEFFRAARNLSKRYPHVVDDAETFADRLEAGEFSSDGTNLAFYTGLSVEWWGLVNGGFRQITSLQQDRAESLSFTFIDGTDLLRVDYMYSYSHDPNITLLRYEEDRVETLFRIQHYPHETEIGMSPDGNQLFLSREVHVVDYQFLTDVFSQWADRAYPSFGYAGTSYGRYEQSLDDQAYLTSDDRVIHFDSLYLHDGTNFTLQPHISFGGNVSSSAAGFQFSPDSSHLLSFRTSRTNCGSEYASMSVWDTRTVEVTGGGDLVRRDSEIVFSPDSSLFALAQLDNLSVRSGIDGNVFVSFDNHTSNIQSVGFTPDGTRILTASADGTVRVWGVQDEN